MTYHHFNTRGEADAFLASQRLAGMTGFYVGTTCGSHEVRVWRG